MAAGSSADLATPEELLGRMWRIRAFELRAMELFEEKQIRGSVHPYIGMEAIAVGVCAALGPDDFITSTHRGHGHCIAKGLDLDRMMAEIIGREDGYCRGRGGSMHITAIEQGMLGADAIVAGSSALAVGAAHGLSLQGRDSVVVCFFGDGAANQGVLHESLNLAAIWKLPVIYVCENNGFAESTPAAYATSVPDVASRAAGYGIPGVVASGADVLAVYGAAREAVARARDGEGPTLLEVKTHRFMGHFEGDPDRYRDDQERKALLEQDALASLRELLLADGHATEAELEAELADVDSAIDRAVAFARASAVPDPAAIGRFVYPEPIEQADLR
jgi:pyruvate dehydrogenase E1 component alpha subunit